jgi:uncharacterized membrane protein
MLLVLVTGQFAERLFLTDLHERFCTWSTRIIFCALRARYSTVSRRDFCVTSNGFPLMVLTMHAVVAGWIHALWPVTLKAASASVVVSVEHVYRSPFRFLETRARSVVLVYVKNVFPW